MTVLRDRKREEVAMRSSLLVVELDTGVRRAGVGVDGAGGGETLGVLVEDDVTIILDEL